MFVRVGRYLLNLDRVDAVEVGGDGVLRVITQAQFVVYLEGEDAETLLAYLLSLAEVPRASAAARQHARALIQECISEEHSEWEEPWD